MVAFTAKDLFTLLHISEPLGMELVTTKLFFMDCVAALRVVGSELALNPSDLQEEVLIVRSFICLQGYFTAAQQSGIASLFPMSFRSHFRQ